MSIVCVTGTSTEVGKTVVTAALAAGALAAGRRVAVIKPAQTGVPDGEPADLAHISRLAGADLTLVELARYPEPLAPDTAARRSGRPMLMLDEVVDRIRRLDESHDLTLIEGAGGVLVRLGAPPTAARSDTGFTLLDVAQATGATAVVVTAAGLGTLNHTELTVRTLAASRVRCAGVIIGSWPEKPGVAELCNLDDLPRVTGVPVLGRIPEGSGALDPAEFVSMVRRRLPEPGFSTPTPAVSRSGSLPV